MKCPNCRCVSPQNTRYCSYCGYHFEDGDTVTLSIEQEYENFVRSSAPYYGYSRELRAYGGEGLYRGYYDEAESGFVFEFDALHLALLGLCCASLLILMLLLLLIM